MYNEIHISNLYNITFTIQIILQKSSFLATQKILYLAQEDQRHQQHGNKEKGQINTKYDKSDVISNVLLKMLLQIIATLFNNIGNNPQPERRVKQELTLLLGDSNQNYAYFQLKIIYRFRFRFGRKTMNINYNYDKN